MPADEPADEPVRRRALEAGVYSPFKPAYCWLRDMKYPELWEAIDEALMASAGKFLTVSPLAEKWVALSKRERAFLHGQLRAALRRRMTLP